MLLYSALNLYVILCFSSYNHGKYNINPIISIRMRQTSSSLQAAPQIALPQQNCLFDMPFPLEEFLHIQESRARGHDVNEKEVVEGRAVWRRA